MGQLFENLRAIAEDFKTSWYFRVWAALWFVFALVAFIALIELGAKSNESGKDKDWNTWIENATQLTFPRFHFRFENRTTHGEEISNHYCTHAGSVVQTSPCEGERDKAKCFVVAANQITVTNTWNAPEGSERITCTFNVTGYNSTKPVNTYVGWSIEGHHRTFSNPFTNTLWIEPRNAPGVAVSLRKRIISPLRNAFYENPNEGWEVWEKSYVYHTTVHTPGEYYISTYIAGFRVEHLEQTNSYNGWMAVGGIGGFAFFMVVLHTLVMIIVGFALPNESKFLTGRSR